MVAEYLALLPELLRSFYQLWMCSTSQLYKLREQSRVVGERLPQQQHSVSVELSVGVVSVSVSSVGVSECSELAVRVR